MNYSIRNYTAKDFPLVSSWWKEAGELSPSESMLSPETTFVLEIEEKPVFCLSVYLTNNKEYAYLGNFVSDVNFKNPMRKVASQILMDTVLLFSKNLGYKNVICMSHEPALQKRYKEMGFTPTISNVQTFVKRIA